MKYRISRIRVLALTNMILVLATAMTSGSPVEVDAQYLGNVVGLGQDCSKLSANTGSLCVAHTVAVACGAGPVFTGACSPTKYLRRTSAPTKNDECLPSGKVCCEFQDAVCVFYVEGPCVPDRIENGALICTEGPQDTAQSKEDGTRNKAVVCKKN
jgi:hypothetical protein